MCVVRRRKQDDYLYLEIKPKDGTCGETNRKTVSREVWTVTQLLHYINEKDVTNKQQVPRVTAISLCVLTHRGHHNHQIYFYTVKYSAHYISWSKFFKRLNLRISKMFELSLCRKIPALKKPSLSGNLIFIILYNI